MTSTAQAMSLLNGADVTLRDLSATLASELALGISDKAKILERHGISSEQWEVLRRAPAFQAMVQEAMRDWNSDLNAPKRTQLKAQVLTEEALTQLDTIVHDVAAPAGARIEAVKTLTRIAGLGEGEGGSGAAFSVNIHLGGDQPVVIEGQKGVSPPQGDG